MRRILLAVMLALVAMPANADDIVLRGMGSFHVGGRIAGAKVVACDDPAEVAANNLSRQAKIVFKANPDARIWIRYHSTPPLRWRKKYPARPQMRSAKLPKNTKW